MQLEVTWKRVWQVKPYETETIELKLGGEFVLPGPAGQSAQAVGKGAALIHQQLLAELTAMGDQIMAERLVAPDPRLPETPRPGRGGMGVRGR